MLSEKYLCRRHNLLAKGNKQRIITLTMLTKYFFLLFYPSWSSQSTHSLFSSSLHLFSKYHFISDFFLSRMAQEGTPEKSSDTSATEVSQIIFGAKNLEYQIEQFFSSGGQTVNILLSGKTGVGKSHLTNALIGENLAAEGYDIDPQTDNVSYFDIDNYFTF